MRGLQSVLLTIIAAVLLPGCVGGALIFDPTDYVRDYNPRQIDWNRAPLSVTRNTARINKELEEAQRNYDGARNAMLERARAWAKYDFEHELPRGAHAPLFGEARDAYEQKFTSLDNELQSKLERGAQGLGELDFYRRHQPR